MFFFLSVLVLSPAEKFIRSQFSSYSFTSCSKHRNRHKHAVQVVRTSLPKIAQAPHRHTSSLRLPLALQGRVHICLPHDKARGSLVWSQIPLAFLLRLPCVLLDGGCELATRANTEPLWHSDDCPLQGGKRLFVKELGSVQCLAARGVMSISFTTLRSIVTTVEWRTGR